MKTYIHICACLTLALFSSSVSAFSVRFQEQVSKGNWDRAERILAREKSRCDSNGAIECLDTLTFSKAWMYSRRALAEKSDTRKSYAFRAAELYREVLTRNPDHLATIDNLILLLEHIGDRPGLEDMVSRLVKLKADERLAKLYLTIARLYADERNFPAAFNSFRHAYDAKADQRALTGLVDIFEVSPKQEFADELWRIASKKASLSQKSVICETIINNRSNVSVELWETAAINWLGWLGRDRQFRSDLIGERVRSGISREFSVLEAVLNEESLGLNDRDLRIGGLTLLENRRNNWWHETKLRTWAFTVAAWSEGHNRLLRGDVKAADRIWRAALQFAPPIRWYSSGELEGKWAVSLELLTDLARLQQIYKPELDPDGRHFKNLEIALFDSKARAYKVNDLAAAQRHHTIMGKMYADLGVFSQSSSPRFRNAEFQLKAAIKTAKTLEKQSGIADPQPVMAKLLADGYSCKLPNQTGGCQLKSAKAKSYYLEAAKGFVKLDAIQPAKDSLKSLNVFQPEGRVKSDALHLDAIINLRSNISNDIRKKGFVDSDIISKQVNLASEWKAIGDTREAEVVLKKATINSKTANIDDAVLRQIFNQPSSAAELNRVRPESLIDTK